MEFPPLHFHWCLMEPCDDIDSPSPSARSGMSINGSLVMMLVVLVLVLVYRDFSRQERAVAAITSTRPKPARVLRRPTRRFFSHPIGLAPSRTSTFAPPPSTLSGRATARLHVRELSSECVFGRTASES